MSDTEYDPPPDDDGFAELIGPLRDIPNPTVEFRRELAESLSCEHARLYGKPSSLGHKSEKTPPRSVLQLPRRRGFRAAAVAALFLLAFSLSWTGADYSWARMVAALAEADWVQVVLQSDDGSSGEGWLASQQAVIAGRRDARVYFYDSQSSATLVPNAGASPFISAGSSGAAPTDLESRLLLVLLQLADPDRVIEPGQHLDWRVVEQQWREAEDGVIEVVVDFEFHGLAPPQMRITFHLNRDSGLPTQAMTSIAGGATTRLLSFECKPEGPQNIYDLGVSRELPVLATGESGIASALVSPAQPSRPEVESTPSAIASERLALGRSSRPSDPQPLGLHASAVRPAAGQSDLSLPSGPDRRSPVGPPPSIDEMVARLDLLMAEHWEAEAIDPVGVADEREFLRRAYLDLAGRIPTVHEATSFLEDNDPERYQKLIDRLLSQHDHASHLATVWRGFLIGDQSNITPEDVRSFESWLTKKFRKNQPYDQVVRDLLLAEGRLEQAGPLVFYAARKLQPEEVARQTSRAFLGVRMDCAQCHDHFFDDRLSQEKFWEFTAFFSQMSSLESQVMRVSPILRVQDRDRGEVTLPGSDEAVAPRLPFEESHLESTAGTSRRKALAEWITDPGNAHFAQATVNRVWSHLFGRGLVDPVDDFRPDNPPVAPMVLDALAAYFVATDFDLRRLFATITRSRAYQLSSAAADKAPRRLAEFGQMNVKCLTAEQLYDCIVVATRVKNKDRDSGGLNRFADSRRDAFVAEFSFHAENATSYEAGIAQALTMMNGSLISFATGRGSSGLIESLRAPFFTDPQRVEVVFLATVSRRPTDPERDAILKMLSEAEGPEQRWAVLGDTLWALVNSAEFTLIP